MMGQDQFSITEPTRFKLTVDDFVAMDDAGLFRDRGRFELLEGEIYQMSPLHAPHARALLQIGAQLLAAVEDGNLGLDALSPVSLRLDEHSLPEPDLVVADRNRDATIIEIGTLRLAIEISATSLQHDLVRKAELYARYGVPEYWVVDLSNRQLHQMTEPAPEGYAAIEVHPFGARVASKLVPQIMVDTSRIA